MSIFDFLIPKPKTLSDIYEEMKVPNWKKLVRKLGNLEPLCPYCNTQLEKFPARKTKCKNCGNFMYIRTSPYYEKKVIVREDELELIEEDYAKKFGKYDEYLKEQKLKKKKEERFANKKKYLEEKFKVKYSDNDVKFSILVEDSIIEFNKKNFEQYANKLEEMSGILFREKRYKQMLANDLIVASIRYCLIGGKLYDREFTLQLIEECNKCFPLLSFVCDAIINLNYTLDDVRKFYLEIKDPMFTILPLTKKEMFKGIEYELNAWNERLLNKMNL